MLSKLIRKIKLFFRGVFIPPPSYIKYFCPACTMELSREKPFFADTRTFYFTYKCGDCNWFSTWDYSFPVPLVVGRHDHKFFIGFYSLSYRKPICDEPSCAKLFNKP